MEFLSIECDRELKNHLGFRFRLQFKTADGSNVYFICGFNFNNTLTENCLEADEFFGISLSGNNSPWGPHWRFKDSLHPYYVIKKCFCFFYDEEGVIKKLWTKVSGRQVSEIADNGLEEDSVHLSDAFKSFDLVAVRKQFDFSDKITDAEVEEWVLSLTAFCLTGGQDYWEIPSMGF
jgi:hypothetical protein